MTNRRPAAATAVTPLHERTFLRWAMMGALTAGLIGGATLLRAESHENVTVSHGYSFFGDLKYDADFEHLNYVNPDAPKGGEISIAGQGTFDSFNRYTLKGNAVGLANIGDEDMVTSFADDPTSIYCFLCETMEYPEDISWVIFNMRPEVTFSDGTPAKAEHVKLFFDTVMKDGLPSFRQAFGNFVDSVEVLDDYRIKYNFSPDSPKRDRIGLAGIIGPMHPTWFADNDLTLDNTWPRGPMTGTGPYVLESFDYSRQVVWKRNPDYWGNDLNINVGRNNFDRIRIEYFGDSTAALEGFKAGTYTFRTENTSRLWATAYDFPAIENGWVKKEELDDGSLGRMQSFIFNLRREKFQDIRVREAIRLMFNFTWSNESLFFGLYERPSSFWEFSENASSGLPSEGELAILQPLVDEGLLDASILTEEAVTAPTSGERQLDRRNLRAASALLDEAGWLVNDEGLREKDGEVLTVEFLESSPSFDRVINPYVENLKRLGIDAKLDRVDPAQEQERARSFDFDMTTQGFSLGYEPSTGLKQWFDSSLRDDTSRNLAGVADPAVDRLIDVVIASETSEELNTSVQALDRVLRSLKFNVPQWQNTKHWVAYWDQYEYPDPLPPLALGQLDFWWFNADKAAKLKEEGAL
ncbi:extracellular solute-binding protein [Shimia ponticola]|uniref:extracellular solute-binding protein n=1 Tax=Shimia ponticola TaxID=2582893 RepID=UPI0011BD7FF7|nr:extracellular solute-binding protein [Shimia ponticola]